MITIFLRSLIYHWKTVAVASALGGAFVFAYSPILEALFIRHKSPPCGKCKLSGTYGPMCQEVRNNSTDGRCPRFQRVI